MQKLKTRTGYESYGLYIKYLDIVFNMWVVVSGTGEKTYQTEGDADEAIKSIIANNFGSEPVAIFIDRDYQTKKLTLDHKKRGQREL